MNSRRVASLIAMVLTGAISLAAPLSAGGNPPSQANNQLTPGFDVRGEALEKVVSVIRGNQPLGVPNGQASRFGASTNTGINYYGGPVMTDSTGVYINIIWYGTWTDKQKSILRTMINGLSGSPYYNINTTYFNAAKVNVANIVTISSEINDAYSLGNGSASALTDAQIWSIVKNAGDNPTYSRAIRNNSALTLVLTSNDVKKSGFLTSYCGWHTYNSSYTTNTVKYAFIGNPGTNSSCAAQLKSPNGDTGVDAMASVVAHEIVEAVTDPELKAWYDSRGYENADKCAWKFGSMVLAADGSYSNMNLGGLNYLIQQNWLNANSGGCVLRY